MFWTVDVVIFAAAWLLGTVPSASHLPGSMAEGLVTHILHLSADREASGRVTQNVLLTSRPTDGLLTGE